MKEFILIGLGRLGHNVALLAKEKNIEVLGVEVDKQNLELAQKAGISCFSDLKSAYTKAIKPCVVMTLLPAGKITQSVLYEALEILKPGDVLIDAGNSYYRDTLKIAELATKKNIEFVDVGNNNGVASARTGACYTVGCTETTYKKIVWLLEALTCPKGLIHTGAVGSGHFVKAVHNAIEYGMMQAFAEGFEIVKNGPFKNVDLTKLSEAWNNGTVIRCHLLSLLHEGLIESPNLTDYKDDMDATGQGLWTVQSSLEQGTPAPVLAMSVIMRYRSKQKLSFAGQIVNCLREKFGGHKVSKVNEKNKV